MLNDRSQLILALIKWLRSSESGLGLNDAKEQAVDIVTKLEAGYILVHERERIQSYLFQGE